MNWKENAHLFMSGNFKVLIEDSELEIRLTTSDWNWIKQRGPFKLIARPISDMSDKEKDAYTTKLGLDWGKFEEAEFKSTVYSSFLYLLSIGVYPYEQSHFEDGTVIARYENEVKP